MNKKRIKNYGLPMKICAHTYWCLVQPVSGKTETLVSLAYNSLLQGSGFIYVDG